MNNYEFDTDIYGTIRKNIRKFRKDRGITSAKLAELTDLSHDYIRQIQSDKGGVGFSVETLYRISVVLDVSLDKFIIKEKKDASL